MITAAIKKNSMWWSWYSVFSRALCADCCSVAIRIGLPCTLFDLQKITRIRFRFASLLFLNVKLKPKKTRTNGSQNNDFTADLSHGFYFALTLPELKVMPIHAKTVQ